jgi:hypothetical protein
MSDISQVFRTADILRVGKDNTAERFVVQPQSMSEYLPPGLAFSTICCYEKSLCSGKAIASQERAMLRLIGFAILWVCIT